MNRLAAMLPAVLVVFAGSARAQDKIVSKDGKERTAKILGEEFDGLKISLEGGSLTIPWKDVDTIHYSGGGKYDEAVDSLLADGPAVALPMLEALAADDKLRPVLLPGVLYHLGLAHQRLGHVDASIAAFEKLLEGFPRSRYLIPSGTNLLALYVTKGDLGRASGLESTLAAAGSSAPKLQVGFDFLRGRILEEQGKYADAEKFFQRLEGATGDDAPVALAAKLALGRCAQRASRTVEAQGRYREIALLDAPHEVLSGAWNGLGDLALGAGMAERDAEELRYALFAYLRGVVLYAPGRGEATGEYERSLAGSAQAFRALGELETDPARKQLFLGRAQQRREQLAAEFPGSRFLGGV